MRSTQNPRCVMQSTLSFAMLGVSVWLAGCGGSGSANTPISPIDPTTVAPTAANSFYTTANPESFLPNPQGPSILQFSRTANGSVAPSSTITGPMGYNFDAVTVDGMGNLYAGGRFFSGTNQAGSRIAVYAAGASGTAAPARTITSGLNALISTGIFSMAVDTANNLYVATDIVVGTGPAGRIYEGIAIYPAGTNTASRVIAGDATGILNPTQIAVDSANNVYVASTGIQAAGSIQVFGPTASGNVAPIRTIAGDATTIYNTRGIAVDATGDIFVSTITLAPQNGPYLGGTPSIVEFAPTANGNVAPTRIISGAAAGLETVGNLRLDSSGNIYALGGPGVLKFAPGATGNVAPESTVTSTAALGEGGPEIAVQ